MLLTCADVHILDINTMGFRINVNQASYKLARSILLTLRESYGLPLHLHSEEVSEISARVKRKNGNNTVSNDSANTIFEKDLPPRYGNVFLVVGHRLVGKDREKMIELAKNVAQKLEAFGLSVAVHK